MTQIGHRCTDSSVECELARTPSVPATRCRRSPFRDSDVTKPETIPTAPPPIWRNRIRFAAAQSHQGLPAGTRRIMVVLESVAPGSCEASSPMIFRRLDKVCKHIVTTPCTSSKYSPWYKRIRRIVKHRYPNCLHPYLGEDVLICKRAHLLTPLLIQWCFAETLEKGYVRLG